MAGNVRKTQQQRIESAATLEQSLARMEEDLRKLKIEFDIFFNGASKRPPLEAKARLDSQIKRILDDRTLTYSQRFAFNALVSKFNSYRELWRRQMKTRGEELL